MVSTQVNGDAVHTRVLHAATSEVEGHFDDRETLENWVLPKDLADLKSVQEAADYLRTENIPVAFPTETVYGLGADATRSDAVKGIYKAKGRPSDNPLIVHVCDLAMLRNLLTSPESPGDDPKSPQIPDIYKPLIKRFWPGPLTILLPNPKPSKLAPEVTAGLQTFGARMPSSPLALTLIRLAGVPLAAPSANASTKPSCTTAEHVYHDLNGRIELILSGGACQVGVESTIVDGLCDPPVILRPGGVSIDEIRECPGWESVVNGYKDQSEIGDKAPRAPGMKYKHYSPKAKVVLYEDMFCQEPLLRDEPALIAAARAGKIEHLGYDALPSDRPATVGTISTRYWGDGPQPRHEFANPDFHIRLLGNNQDEAMYAFMTQKYELWSRDKTGSMDTQDPKGRHLANCFQISLGSDVKDIAHGLFSALRELDQRGCDVIYVEGIEDEGDIAAAVMNRLRKAATVIQK